MNKWLKIGIVTAAISVAILGAVGFAVLRSTPVNAQGGGGSMLPGFGRGGFVPPAAQFGRMDQFGRGEFGPPAAQFGQMDLFGRGGWGGTIDRDALLAEALGITVEELEAAYQEAHTAAVQQALDEGLITQDEADLILARIQLKSYLDRDALLAQALGITAEELQAARDEGKPLPVLIYEQEIDPTTMRTNMQNAVQDAVQQAVTDGVITQDQADEILNGMDGNFGRRGGFGGPGGHGGRSGFGGHPGAGGFGWN